jgi:hypothetical protein
MTEVLGSPETVVQVYQITRYNTAEHGKQNKMWTKYEEKYFLYKEKKNEGYMAAMNNLVCTTNYGVIDV